MASIPSRPATALSKCQRPLYDFLAPKAVPSALSRRSFRVSALSQKVFDTVSIEPEASAPYRPSSEPSRVPRAGPAASASPAPLSKPLTPAQREFLDSALRVNQAGELAATLIYKAQTPPIIRSHPHLRPLMKHMYDQEADHFKTFNGLLAKHRIRPTAMYPLWQIAATTLGWTTAMLGREAAMACTEAVETEIGGHYNGQVKVLLDMVAKMEAEGEEPGEELTELVKNIRRIRDEELEHLDHAVENDEIGRAHV